jgi:hypothetical protein
MAWDAKQFIIPGLYSTLDNSAWQFCPVKLTAANIITHISTTNAGIDAPIGILLNAPTTNQAAEVCWLGICKVKVGDAVTFGMLLGNDTGNSGYGYPVTANVSTNTNAIWGQALSDASSDGYVTAMVNFANINFGSS